MNGEATIGAKNKGHRHLNRRQILGGLQRSVQGEHLKQPGFDRTVSVRTHFLSQAGLDPNRNSTTDGYQVVHSNDGTIGIPGGTTFR